MDLTIINNIIALRNLHSHLAVVPVLVWSQFELGINQMCFLFIIDLRDYAVPSMLQNVRPQMVLSIDNNIYDLRRPFEPPLPTDPTANICQQDPKSSTNGGDEDPIAESSNIDSSFLPCFDC